MQADWVIGLWNGIVSLFGIVSFIFVSAVTSEI